MSPSNISGLVVTSKISFTVWILVELSTDSVSGFPLKTESVRLLDQNASNSSLLLFFIKLNFSINNADIGLWTSITLVSFLFSISLLNFEDLNSGKFFMESSFSS